MNEFDARRYWEERLGATGGLAGVGFIGLGEAFNRWMYRVRRRVFMRTARRHLGDRAALRVLDVGSGTGFYLDRWRELGATSITGSDLTDVAVERLRAGRRGAQILTLDIGGEVGLAERFDAISAMDVLFHIVDDDAFGRAIENLARLLEPGGILLVSDNFVRGQSVRADHHVSRSLSEFETAFARAGLEPVERRPMFVLMNGPADSSSRLLRAWWTRLSSLMRRRPWLGSALGALLYPLEVALLSAVREGPSTELMVCERVSQRGP